MMDAADPFLKYGRMAPVIKYYLERRNDPLRTPEERNLEWSEFMLTLPFKMQVALTADTDPLKAYISWKNRVHFVGDEPVPADLKYMPNIEEDKNNPYYQRYLEQVEKLIEIRLENEYQKIKNRWDKDRKLAAREQYSAGKLRQIKEAEEADMQQAKSQSADLVPFAERDLMMSKLKSEAYIDQWKSGNPLLKEDLIYMEWGDEND